MIQPRLLAKTTASVSEVASRSVPAGGQGVLRPEQQRHKDLPARAHWSVSVSLTSRLQWRDARSPTVHANCLLCVLWLLISLCHPSAARCHGHLEGAASDHQPLSVHLFILLFLSWPFLSGSGKPEASWVAQHRRSVGSLLRRGAAEAEGSAATETYDVLLHLTPLFWLLRLSDQPFGHF